MGSTPAPLRHLPRRPGDPRGAARSRTVRRLSSSGEGDILFTGSLARITNSVTTSVRRFLGRPAPSPSTATSPYNFVSNDDTIAGQPAPDPAPLAGDRARSIVHVRRQRPRRPPSGPGRSLDLDPERDAVLGPDPVESRRHHLQRISANQPQRRRDSTSRSATTSRSPATPATAYPVADRHRRDHQGRPGRRCCRAC